MLNSFRGFRGFNGLLRCLVRVGNGRGGGYLYILHLGVTTSHRCRHRRRRHQCCVWSYNWHYVLHLRTACGDAGDRHENCEFSMCYVSGVRISAGSLDCPFPDNSSLSNTFEADRAYRRRISLQKVSTLSESFRILACNYSQHLQRLFRITQVYLTMYLKLANCFLGWKLRNLNFAPPRPVDIHANLLDVAGSPESRQLAGQSVQE
mmetsp:Transcript_15749/g.30440  ORF Transcript_15749/g.30440 Transcript_15749/m.30440 type:complete len:206 (+) Transcript_15749:1133-1750(+)